MHQRSQFHIMFFVFLCSVYVSWSDVCSCVFFSPVVVCTLPIFSANVHSLHCHFSCYCLFYEVKHGAVAIWSSLVVVSHISMLTFPCIWWCNEGFSCCLFRLLALSLSLSLSHMWTNSRLAVVYSAKVWDIMRMHNSSMGLCNAYGFIRRWDSLLL